MFSLEKLCESRALIRESWPSGHVLGWTNRGDGEQMVDPFLTAETVLTNHPNYKSSLQVLLNALNCITRLSLWANTIFVAR